MSNLIKEAIADAKAVREMAVKQARAALEEAFGPRVEDLISKRITSEADDEVDDTEEFDGDAEELEIEEDEFEAEPEVSDEEEDSGLTEDEDTSGIGTSDNKEPSNASSEESTEDLEGEIDVDTDHDTATESDLTESDDADEDDIDLEEIIKELEDEADEVDDDEEFEIEEDESEAEPEVSEEEEDDAEVFETDDADDDDENGDFDSAEGDEELEFDVEDDGDEEEIDLESLVNTSDEEELEELNRLRKENVKLNAKLKESLSVVRLQKSRLNEINVLNAKLLFTNKVFSKFSLDDSSKIKVIENFDRAKNVREIKLIFAAIMENMQANKRKISSKAQRLVEGASKAIASTISKKAAQDNIISEQDDVRNRVHKLMGHKK